MTYLEFLGRWYNLAFLAVAGSAVAVALYGRLRDRDTLRATASLAVAAVVGLTWNGAIHDLGLGSPAARFPWAVLAAALTGWLVGRTVAGVRDRYFRPVTAVRFNRPGHEGREALVVTREVGPEPGSGRAQWQDAAGVLHIVHVHTEGDSLGFGRMVRLEAFDEDAGSYLARPVPREKGGDPSGSRRSV